VSEVAVEEIQRMIRSWMAVNRTRNWTSVLMDVTLEMNNCPLLALGGQTLKVVVFLVN
jgi:hypothetical protein